jgi:hypothetical protein
MNEKRNPPQLRVTSRSLQELMARELRQRLSQLQVGKRQADLMAEAAEQIWESKEARRAD